MNRLVALVRRLFNTPKILKIALPALVCLALLHAMHFPGDSSVSDEAEKGAQYLEIVEIWAGEGIDIYSLDEGLSFLANRLPRKPQVLGAAKAASLLSASTPAILLGASQPLQALHATHFSPDTPQKPFLITPGAFGLVVNKAYSSKIRTATACALPKKAALRIAALGDMGNMSPGQFRLGSLLAEYSNSIDSVVLLGDNIYYMPESQSEIPALFKSVFELPYERILKAGVPFYAVLGNHDLGLAEEELHYGPFNMQGRRYYSVALGENLLEIFMLDSNTLRRKDKPQVRWLRNALARSTARWKVLAFHHVMYTVADDHEGKKSLRRALEPIIEEYKIPLVLCGHSHVYARRQVPGGCLQIVAGSSGQLRSDATFVNAIDFGFNRDNAFVIMDINPEGICFYALSASGELIDRYPIGFAGSV